MGEQTVETDYTDGCVNEHSPGSNPECIQVPAGTESIAGSFNRRMSAIQAEHEQSELADTDTRFRWDVWLDEGGLPVHLPMGVTVDGRGPTLDAEAHHFVCWCADPKCLLTRALHEAWNSGVRTSPGSPTPEEGSHG